MYLVGYPEQSVVSKKFSDSFIGGSPILLPGVKEKSIENVECQSCQSHMRFLCQIYCPIEDQNFHRCIYIFICINKRCQTIGKNWRVFSLSSKKKFLNKIEQVKDSDWGDFSDDEVDSWDFKADDIYAQKWEAPNEEKSEMYDVDKFFVQHFINVYEDTVLENDDDYIEKAISTTEDEETKELLLTVKAESPHAISEPKLDLTSFNGWIFAHQLEMEFNRDSDINYEGQLQNHAATRIEHGLETIRYKWKGIPIFKDAPIADLIPRLICSACGSQRVFEFQIFSSINNYLKPSSKFTEEFRKSIEGHELYESIELDDSYSCSGPLKSIISTEWPLNISTVIIFSCTNCALKCHDALEECCLVQTENNINTIND